jgi:OTU domain-containing protein 6
MDLQQKHRDEVKELRARLQAMKHGVSRGDKKEKKRVAIEMQRLEAELKERHRKELEEWQSVSPNETADIDDSKISETAAVKNVEEQSFGQTRAGKRRVDMLRSYEN